MSQAARLGSKKSERTALRFVTTAKSVGNPAASSGDATGVAAAAAAAVARIDDHPAFPPDADTDDDSEFDPADFVSLAGSFHAAPSRRSREATAVTLTAHQKAERSYYRMMVALNAGGGAVMGSKAELVLGFCGTVR